MLDFDRIETITFDSFSTIVDMDSTATAVEGYVDDSVAFAREWYSRAANYSMVANHIDAYETYYDLHRDALSYLWATKGFSVSDDEIDEIITIYYEIEPFDDVRDEMKHLRDRGYNLGIISNGNPSIVNSLIRVADIDELVSKTVSADEIERHKPAQDLYEWAVDQLNVDSSAIIHVSNGYTDVQEAMHASMQDICLNCQEAVISLRSRSRSRY